ncbi:BON domain-containing protein [Methylomagnum sp.]
MSNLNPALIKSILADLEQDSRVDARHFPIRVKAEDGTLVLEGTVADIAAKRIARHIAHSRSHEAPVLDRLRVAVPESEGAGKLRDEVVNLLQTEAAFNTSGLYLRDGDRLEAVREVRDEWGNHRVEIEAQDGTVILTGEVLSLTHRRMAEVLAWWAVGCESVENLLHVVPPEQETDDELADAIRMVMEKDPLVRADQLQIKAQHGQVTLAGTLLSNEERYLAVQDAWYVPGVQDVVDGILVAG